MLVDNLKQQIQKNNSATQLREVKETTNIVLPAGIETCELNAQSFNVLEDQMFLKKVKKSSPRKTKKIPNNYSPLRNFARLPPKS